MSLAVSPGSGKSQPFAGIAELAPLLLVFVAALLPYAVTWVVVYPDEPQYLDAGVLMAQRGDYLMPACPNDAPPEDLKPILSYWIVAASYALFGSSVAAARLPFLLAGVGIVWLTHRLAWLLSGSRAAALVACVVLLCNPLFWLSAIRCIPDVLLCFFLLMSVYGYLGLLIRDDSRTRFAMLTYLGIALAFLTKGVPALVYLALMIGFAIVNRWRPRAWRRLVHVPAILIALAIGASWFIAAWLTHGTDELKLLWSDQVGNRLTRRPSVIAYRFPLALLALAAGYLPWCWPIVRMGRRWREVLPANSPERLPWAFLVLWTLVTVLAMTACADWYSRYLIPAFPVVSILFGMCLAKIDADALQSALRQLLGATLACVWPLILLAALVAFQLGLRNREIVIGTALIAIAAVVSVAGLRGSWRRAGQAIAIVVLLLLPVSFLVANMVARTDLEGRMVNALRTRTDEKLDAGGFIGQKAQASRVRLALGRQVSLLQWEQLPAKELPAVIALPEEAARRLPADQYDLIPAGSVFAELPDEAVAQAILDGKFGEYLGRHRVRYYIAVQRKKPAALSVTR